MLAELQVEHLGIIEELSVVLGQGLTVITGETGAGKTLVVEALELLVGGRADPALVRPGAEEARVAGRFVDGEAGDPDAELVLARVVPVDGRSRAYVNGQLVTATELAVRGAGLVDLHGQHTHQSLLAPAVQRAALDRFAGSEAAEALGACRAARVELRRIDEALAALGGDARSRAREVDLLRFQLSELDAADLADPAEDVALEAEEVLLADAEAHRSALSFARAGVEGPAVDAVGEAAAALAGRSPFAELEARLRAAQAELAELAHDLRLAHEHVADDPERLETVRARRRLLRELARKYGETIPEMLAFADETRRRLRELDGYEERAATLERDRAAAGAEWRSAAARLGELRRRAAEPFAASVEENLRALAMPDARFEIEMEPADPGEPGDAGPAAEVGTERVAFLFAANPGEPARPLSKVASGGELSRAMLAVRVALVRAASAAFDGITLVFDEVDAGLGGEAGGAVGRQLAELAGEQQVLCVTHLAQVAACADAQVAVTKRSREGRTVAHAELVLGDARVGELSRMLAGVGESAHARRHARELLHASERASAPPVTASRSTGPRSSGRSR